MAIFYFVLGLLMFIGLVVVHELGHFYAARRNDIEVEEFGIGFPPMAWKRKLKSGLLFTINWLPLGGFVKLKGEHDADTAPGSFGAASTSAKVKVMLAGVAMNLVAAFVIFSLVAVIGMPKLLDNQFTVARDTKIIKDVENKGVVKIDQIVKNSPAEHAGIKSEEQILAVGTHTISTPEALTTATKEYAGTATTVQIKAADGTIRTIPVTLNSASPYLGVAPYSAQIGTEVRRSTWSAPVVAVGVGYDFTIATVKGLGTAVKGLGSILAGTATGNKVARQQGQQKASEQVSGPLGIGVVMYQISKLGIGFVLFVIGLISLTLAIMNVLPIPALDGGRLFVMLLFRALKKPLLPQAEERIHGTGFAVLMVLVVVITVVDARRFF